MQRIQAEDENPMKCAFGVTYGKFLGYLVNRQGMNVDPAKAKAVLDMPLSEKVEVIFRKSFLLEKVLTRVSSLIGPSYGIAKEKGGVQMGRGPSTSLCENQGDLSERPSDDGSNSR